MSTVRRFVGTVLLALVAALAVGCGEEETIHTYQAPKPPPQPEADAPSGMASGGNASGQMPGRTGGGSNTAASVDWTVPDGWRGVERQAPMRVATFLAGDGDPPVEIAVSSIRGDAGGLLANINRWRRQLGLGPVQQPPEPTTEFEAEGLTGRVFALGGSQDDDGQSGSNGQRQMLVAVISAPSRTWFVKTTDTAARLAGQRQALVRFAESFKLKAASAPSTQPAMTGAATAPSGRRVEAAGGRIAWTLPANWQQAQPRGPVLAAYRTQHGDRNVRITVTRLRGQGGGAMANVNRWRGQLGKQPVESMADQPHRQVPIDGQPATVLNMTGQSQRMIVVMLLGQDASWFFKVTGPDHAVAATAGPFARFLQSIDLKGAGR
jgi:hypothetical protein